MASVSAPASATSRTVFVHAGSPARLPEASAAALRVACPVAAGAGDEVPDDLVAAQLRALDGAGWDRVVLSGGDLLQRAGALALLSAARKVAKEVEVWTQAAPLVRPEVCAAIRRSGATHVGLPMYGDNAEGHDFVAGAAGHFQRTLRAAQTARAAGLQVVFVVSLLRPTFRGLQGLVQKCVPAGISALRIVALPGPDRDAHPLLFPLAMAGPHVRAALAVAAAGRFAALPLQLPMCVTGPVAARDDAHVFCAGGAEEREYGPACGGCADRDACAGQAAERAALHGWVGLVPRSGAAAA